MDLQKLPKDYLPLDPGRPDHRIVLDELAAMSRWSGIGFTVVNNFNGEVRAEKNDVILLDFNEIREYFACVDFPSFQTAIVLALGHELGHLIQYAILGYNEAVARDPQLCEAQADLFAGAWLGLRIGVGTMHTVPTVSRLALRLATPESHAHLYPDVETRDRLLIKGLSLGAILNNASNRTSVDLAGVVTRQDFDDLWLIAKRIVNGSIL